MPLYEVEHSDPLSNSEKDALATRVTQAHLSLYKIPSFFVSVKFTDISTHDVYAGAKRQTSCNRILAQLRTGGSRTAADFNKLADTLANAWESVIIEGDKKNGSPIRELNGVFVLRSVESLIEHGLVLPQFGQDEEWLSQNIPVFRERAQAGDANFQGILDELQALKDT